MMKLVFCITLCFTSIVSFAQEHGFRFGEVTMNHFSQTIPARDSSAAAVVLNEFGEAYVIVDRNGDSRLIFEHHYLIRILKQSGVEEANIEIPLYKSDDKLELLQSVQATSYNIEDNKIRSFALDKKNIFTENVSKYWDNKKFTIPNVRKGSIIEVSYTLDAPFSFYVRTFRKWEFQSDLPKLVSEYWATIPGNYTYNISWKGFLKLSKNESGVITDCFNAGQGNVSDCARYKFAMKNIPAFIEEDYMTSKSNFLASMNFELVQVNYFTGGVNKVTNEWKHADDEMKRESYFGGQIKKGKDISQKIEPKLAGVTDPLEKAKIIYDFIKTWYKWNGYYAKYSDGIKKSFEAKTGTIADINLSLIAALRNSGLDVEALILSTRENGLATELYPVLSDFNYVIAKLNIGDKVYLLDASDPYLPFGALPIRCLNGKGRVFSDKKPSYWYDLKPIDKYKNVSVLDLTLTTAGTFTGTIQVNYYGYDALVKRKAYYSFSSQDEYLTDLKKNLKNTVVNKYEVSGMDDLSKPIIEKMEVEIEGFDNAGPNTFLLNPFFLGKFLGKIERNPFRSTERLYPVDYGAPLETTVVLNLTYPKSMELESLPDNSALTLPNAGGRFLYDVTNLNNKLTVNYQFTINKSVFSSGEYRFLKELYDRIIQAQSTDVIFKKVN